MHYRNLFPLKIEFLKIKRDISLKNQLHNNYKIYRNHISTLMKSTKQNYYTKYIESNKSNIKNTWKNINSIFSKRSSSLINSTLLTFQNRTTDNPKRIANIYNNHLSTIDKKTQAKIKYSHKNYTDHLTNENSNSLFLPTTDKKKLN